MGKKQFNDGTWRKCLKHFPVVIFFKTFSIKLYNNSKISYFYEFI